MRKPCIPTAEEIVQYAVSSGRLEGKTLDEATNAVARRIAHGQISHDEIKAWQRARVAEIQAEARSRN
ncbi:hypothetical protein CO665_34615 [Rhizobium anhuiense]|nr:hypothetical protein CO665_34615 [Rhizobium anhuiense]